VTIILDSSNAWHDLLEVVKTKARAGKVWEYVDPSLTADKVLKLIKPKIPKAPNTKEGAMSPIDLTDEPKKLQ
jgi:hypothetical protein